MPIQIVCPVCSLENSFADEGDDSSRTCAKCGRMLTVADTAKTTSNASPRLKKIGKIVGVVGVVFFVCGGLLYPFVQRAMEAGNGATCNCRLKMLGAALHEYHDAHGHLPPAYTVDENGKPLHSWRTLLLPFVLSEDAAKKIDLNEPWDSPKNLAAFQKLSIQLFRCPSSHANESGRFTNFVVVTGPGTIFDNREGRSFAEITDGMSNTIMLVEIEGQDIPWMKPQDITLDDFTGAATGQSIAGSKHPGFFQVGMGDGAVKRLRPPISSKTLRKLVLRNDGEAVSVDAL